MNQKVALALSGGVDSAVAAWMLKQQGYSLIGLTMALYPPEWAGVSIFPFLQDAERVAETLEIEHHILDARDIFLPAVVEPFVSAYQKGLTPNPCMRCNPEMKLGWLWETARAWGVEKIATGHYARCVFNQQSQKFLIQRDAGNPKDQSYFLAGLSDTQRDRLILPLGGLRKEDVRQIAQREKLPVHEKKESQEICFIPHNKDYKQFLEEIYHFKPLEGPIKTLDGATVGAHQGYWRYTVGQRRGLCVAAAEPMYVVTIQKESNTVVIGPKSALYKNDVHFSNAHWIVSRELLEGQSLVFKIRFRSELYPGIIETREPSQGTVRLLQPAYAVTPGQYIVGYREDDLVFSAMIVG